MYLHCVRDRPICDVLFGIARCSDCGRRVAVLGDEPSQCSLLSVDQVQKNGGTVAVFNLERSEGMEIISRSMLVGDRILQKCLPLD